MSDTLAIIQARTTSRRFPNKVLQPIAGEPLLHRMIERVQRSFKIDRMIVATSTDPSDDPILDVCERLNVPTFRGALDDVLDRYYQAACRYEARQIVRLTADCPLVDPALIDDVIAEYHCSGCDYCSIVTDRTYPIGLDTEVFSFGALSTAWLEATDAHDREHVTPLLRRNSIRFRHGIVKDARDRSDMRWVVDYPDDLEFVRQVFERLYPFGPIFSREDVFELLEACPELAEMNAGRNGMPMERMAA